MNKIFSTSSIIIFSLFLFCNLNAQENTVSAGGEASGSGGTMSYTVGQVDYITQIGISGTVNQGVQQPFEIFTVGIKENSEISLEILLYPNPTKSDVRLKIPSEFIEKLSYQLFDLNGRLLASHDLNELVTVIPTEELARATYLLNVKNEKHIVSSFKIIKNQ